MKITTEIRTFVEQQTLDWSTEATYLGRCYGSSGNELGSIPVSIASVVLDDDDDDGKHVIGWVVAETPDEATVLHSIWGSEEEAREAAEDLAAELDETPETQETQEIIEEIKATSYFDDPAIIDHVVSAATGYSQGYILVTPDIAQPVGTRWTTNGYLQCDYIELAATYGTEAEAAEALLHAIQEAE